jgi:hypothetical protein
LALALHRAAPYLRDLGVRTLYFSSAYSYRRTSSGRLSRHAFGLAIDIHQVQVEEEVLDLRKDYELGMADICQLDAPLLNRLGCLFKALGLFDEVLTPDFDRDHYNHFHLSLDPL